jgi:formate dehydrogenase subunit delta
MTDSAIVMMANQIARNLARGHGDPVQATAEHINSFWDPRMRAQLFVALNDTDSGLFETVRSAKPLLRSPPAPI